MAPPSSQALLRPRNAQLSSYEDALTYSYQTSPLPQLKVRNWRTASGGEDLLSEFGVRRRSAAYYLNLYYECMDAISAGTSSYDYGTSDAAPDAPPGRPSTGNGDMTQLKIYRDTILRELIVMEEIALFVEQTYTSVKEPTIPAKPTIWTIGCCCAAALNFSTVVTSALAVGAVAGGIAMGAPLAWNRYHTMQLRGIIKSLRELKPTGYEYWLDASRFKSLERVAENTIFESGRVVEDEL